MNQNRILTQTLKLGFLGVFMSRVKPRSTKLIYEYLMDKFPLLQASIHFIADLELFDQAAQLR